ncbi:hypothetical protein SCHPADRAFT_896005 [Schizopora paradoxa]|uniref:Uncharacterized protein n=1 Tax=Schizopora paradoxa TaxID=27342 RepID=A0A0H2R1X4_9AGAM|nr:hypothetical protein SCHPADRAFT_896005 [Schizopora paradoxa]
MGSVAYLLCARIEGLSQRAIAVPHFDQLLIELRESVIRVAFREASEFLTCVSSVSISFTLHELRIPYPVDGGHIKMQRKTPGVPRKAKQNDGPSYADWLTSSLEHGLESEFALRCTLQNREEENVGLPTASATTRWLTFLGQRPRRSSRRRRRHASLLIVCRQPDHLSMSLWRCLLGGDPKPVSGWSRSRSVTSSFDNFKILGKKLEARTALEEDV